MAKKTNGEKKENPILIGILFILGAVFLIAKSNEFVWMLFGVIEIPLWILGILAAVVGVLSLVKGIKEKKGKK